jgi:hypothetical protein
MIDFIASETKKIIYNCIERESKRLNIPLEKTRLSLALNGDGSNAYGIIEEIESDGVKDFKLRKELTFMGVLDVKIDFKMYSQIAPPFVQKALIRFSNLLSIPFEKISAVCYPTYNKGEIAICIFNGKVFVKQITISDLFSEEDMIPQE